MPETFTNQLRRLSLPPYSVLYMIRHSAVSIVTINLNPYQSSLPFPQHSDVDIDINKKVQVIGIQAKDLYYHAHKPIG